MYFSTQTHGRVMISGPLIDAVQTLLNATGDTLDVDSRLGPNSLKCLCSWQATCGFGAPGLFDEPQWTRLSALPPLIPFDLLVNIAASFEGTYFTGAVGAFDSGGLTWGILGFTLSSGEIERVFQDIEARSPGLIARIFGADHDTIMHAVTLRGQAAVDWARTISTGANNTGLISPWDRYFTDLGRTGAAKAAQMDQAFQTYFAEALGYVQTYMPGKAITLLDLAFWFDVAIQNSIGHDEAAALHAVDVSALSNIDCRRAFARIIASHSAPEWQADVLSRKMTFAEGTGTVHGSHYDLSDWGIVDQVVPMPDMATGPVLIGVFAPATA